jgi:hypothetical protein
MPGLGRKTWSPGDTLNAADVNGYLMDQSVMVFAGTAARSSAIPTPSAGMVAYSTATSLQVYNGSAWVDLSTGYGTFTGGTALATPPTGYTGAAFTSDGTMTVTKAGLFEVLAIGGGGGGGSNNDGSLSSGGGGGGGVTITTIYLEAGAHTVVVGAGGAQNVNGQSTSIDSNVINAVGGGRGGGRLYPFSGGTGGSGGGQFYNNGNFVLGFGFVGLGNNGGTPVTNNAGSGGGGFSAVGGAGSGTTGGAGGAGYDIATFTGNASTFKAAGGGGGGNTTGGAGGSSVGGAGGSNTNGSAAAANTGSGGGGQGGAGTNGGAGGSGYIAIRVKS